MVVVETCMAAAPRDLFHQLLPYSYTHGKSGMGAF
jgi:hypothetical protein